MKTGKTKTRRVQLWSDVISNPIPTRGYIPFSQAAFWIAAHGGTVRFNLEDSSAWKLAYDQLLRRIESGEVEAIGRRRGGGTSEIIAKQAFSKIRVSYPFMDTPDELLFGTYPYVLCYGPVDDEHWQRDDGFDDKLFVGGRTGPAWTHLQVSASDIGRLWPFESPQPHNVRGRSPVWDQEEAIQFLCEKFKKCGHFNDSGQTDDWSRQCHAEDAVIDHLSKLSQSDGPSRSWARRIVKLAETKWRQAVPVGDTP